MSEEKEPSSAIPNQIRIYYEKSTQYRTIHADGAWAGITPQGHIQFAIFSDLRAIPDYTLNELTPEGQIGKQIDKLEKTGIIRETEVSIVLPPVVAEQLVNLLKQMLSHLEDIQAQATQVRVDKTEDTQQQ